MRCRYCGSPTEGEYCSKKCSEYDHRRTLEMEATVKMIVETWQSEFKEKITKKWGFK